MRLLSRLLTSAVASRRVRAHSIIGLRRLCLGAGAALAISCSPAHAASGAITETPSPQPATWTYDFLAGVARASFPGIVNATVSGGIYVAQVTPDTGLDSSAALQTFFNIVMARGGVGLIPPGVYHLSTEVIASILPGVTMSADIWAAGVVLKGLVGNVGGLLRFSGSSEPYAVTIYGIGADVVGNAQLDRAFAQNGCAWLSWDSCNVKVGAGVAATFKSWRVYQTNPDNDATGNVWCSFPRCAIRSTGGVIACNGFYLEGGANRITFDESISITGVRDAIVLTYAAGTTIPVVNRPLPENIVVKCAFEGVTNTVLVTGAAGGFNVHGLRIDNCRYEVVTTMLNMQGCTLNHAMPPEIRRGNTYEPASITNLVVNPNGLAYSINGVTPGALATISLAGAGAIMRNLAATNFILQLDAPNNMKLLSLSLNGVEKSAWTLNGAGVVWGASGVFNYVNNLGGISIGSTQERNVTGFTVLDGAGNGTVTFPIAEPDTNYNPFLSQRSGGVGGHNWSAATTAGFTVVGTAGAVIFWFLIRTS